MFDIGWTELLILAVIAILIVGPKDLPRMLYSLGQALGTVRRQADEFRRQFNASMREAGMDEVRNDMKKMSDLNPANQIRNEIESTFSDNPKPDSNGKTTSSAQATEASTTVPAEGDLDPDARSEPPAAPFAAPEPQQRPAEIAATEPQSAKDQTHGDRTPVGKRNANANGAAEAKDTVS
jgi:sec-independent protein translocase protein TatB